MGIIKILVADDHVLVREGIVAMLANRQDLEVVCEASNGAEVVEKLKTNEVDVVVMDIMMPELNGFDATKYITANHPNVKVLLVSMDVNREFIGNAISNGALGYIPKDCKKSILIEAVLSVSRGEKYFNGQITDLIFNEFFIKSKGNLRKSPKEKREISQREMEVLKLISMGKSNRQIAEELFISVRTVDAHRNHIMKKINANSTADLVKYAIKNDIVEI